MLFAGNSLDKAQSHLRAFHHQATEVEADDQAANEGVAGVASDHCLPVECAVIDGEANQHLCQLASVLAHLPHRCEHVFQIGRFIAPWRFGSRFS